MIPLIAWVYPTNGEVTGVALDDEGQPRLAHHLPGVARYADIVQ